MCHFLFVSFLYTASSIKILPRSSPLGKVDFAKQKTDEVVREIKFLNFNFLDKQKVFLIVYICKSNTEDTFIDINLNGITVLQFLINRTCNVILLHRAIGKFDCTEVIS